MPLFEQQLKGLAARGVRTWVLRRQPSRLHRDVGMMAAFRQKLRENGPYDVLHGHSSKGGALVRLAFGTLQRSARIHPSCLVHTQCASSTIPAACSTLSDTSPGVPR